MVRSTRRTGPRWFVLWLLPILAFHVTPAPAFDNSVIDETSVDDEHLLALYCAGGRPLNDNDDPVTILVNHGYAVGYSETRRNPLWAVYKASQIVDGTRTRYERPGFFRPDTRVEPAVDGRTFGNDMDRGHMVPNAVIGSQYGSLAQMETFFMTNMCPQHEDLNQGPWRSLERWVILEAQERDHLYVIAGPIFGPDPDVVEKGSERGIQVPEAFYMIVVDAEREYADKPTIRLLAYRFPQDTPRSANFMDRTEFGVSIDDIEEATGLDFFPEYEDLFARWSTKERAVELDHW